MGIVSIHFPQVIQSYIDASNAHDVASILGCFTDDAVVQDESQAIRGKDAIKLWLATTIKKYRFQFRAKDMRTQAEQMVVTMEVAGTFPGSPVTLDYHFTLTNDKIASLTIDS